jgi:hypothetical protein
MRCVAIGAIHGGKRSRGFTKKVTVVGTCGQVSSGSVKKITTKVKKTRSYVYRPTVRLTGTF